MSDSLCLHGLEPTRLCGISVGFPRQQYWSRLPFPFPGDLPNPGIKPVSPALAGRFFTTEPPGKHPEAHVDANSKTFLINSLPSRSRVPWMTRRSNQAILKEINPDYSLEGLMLKLKLWYFGHLIRRGNSLEKTLMQFGTKHWAYGAFIIRLKVMYFLKQSFYPGKYIEIMLLSLISSVLVQCSFIVKHKLTVKNLLMYI